MEVESTGADMEEDRTQNETQELGVEVIDVFQIQLQKNDQESLRQKILSEEDPTYIEQSGVDSMEEDQANNKSNDNPTLEMKDYQQVKSSINEDIHLTFKYAKIGKQWSSYPNYPAVISIDTHSKDNSSTRRVPIDLVCIVDNSASMSSENKMKLVRKSLRYLLKILNEKDRISIITFSAHSKIRTGFLRNSLENKEKLKSIIKKLNTASTTNIAEGIDNCMWLLKNRKYKNPITSVFLLSDGKDDHSGVVERVEDIMNKYQMNEVDFEINTFGYGSDHDPIELNGISKLRDGNFYFIKELKRISEYFILALSGLLNALVENASVTFELQDFVIKKVYGAEDMWKKNPNTSLYEITQPHLIEGDLKYYVCELTTTSQIALSSEQYSNNYASLYGKLLTNRGEKHEFQKIISVTLEECQSEEDIRDLCINLLRAKGAVACWEARCVSISNIYQSQTILEEFLDELNNSPYSQDPQFRSLQEDIEKALMYYKKQKLCNEEIANIIKKERSLLKRTGSISSGLGWTDGQQQIMQEYKEGKLALSDDSCPSRYGDEKMEQDFTAFEDVDQKMQDENEANGKHIVVDNYVESDGDNAEKEEYEEFNQMVRETKEKNKNFQLQQSDKAIDGEFNHNHFKDNNENEIIVNKQKKTKMFVDDDDEDEEQISKDSNENEDGSNDIDEEGDYKIKMMNENEDDEEQERQEGQDGDDDDDEDEEDIVLSSLAQKLIQNKGKIDTVIKKHNN